MRRAKRRGSRLTRPSGADGTPRRHTIGRVLIASAVVLALATGLGVVYLYRHLSGNLDVVDVTGQLGDDRPEKKGVTGPQEPLNVLVMGSDDRDAAGNNIDNQELGSTRPLRHDDPHAPLGGPEARLRRQHPA